MVKNLLMQLATSLRLRNGADSCVTDTAEVERRHERRTTDDQYLANIFLGQRCIFVPNEWNDPIVGRVEHIDLSRGVTCHVFDYVHNEPNSSSVFRCITTNSDWRRCSNLIRSSGIRYVMRAHITPRLSSNPFIQQCCLALRFSSAFVTMVFTRSVNRVYRLRRTTEKYR